MRNIGDLLTIRDADELLVYFHKEECFYRINQQNFHTFFPKKDGVNKCRTCPMFYVKYTGKLSCCQTKIENFSQFKVHLAESEKIFGELVAFKNGSKLPDKSNYKKHRMYGHLWPFQTKDDFLMFDTRQKKFTKIERKNVTKTYTKKGICNFCPCDRKLQSSTTVIKHLQVLETRFFCYLMLEDERYNDAKNQERLNVYLNCIKTKEINSKIFSRRSNYTGNSSKGNLNDGNFIDDESDYDDSIASFTEEADENPVLVLNEFRNVYEKSFEKMNCYFAKLKNKMSSTNLNQGVIDAQAQMSLIRRNEDFQEKEKELTFMRSVCLNYENLDYLMKKYGITDDFEIDKAEVTLNLQLKEGPVPKKEISIPIQPPNEHELSLGLPVSRNVQLERRSLPITKSPIRIREIVYETGNNEMNDDEQIEDANLEYNEQSDLEDEDDLELEINESPQFDDNALNGFDNDETMETHELDDLIEDATDYASYETLDDGATLESALKENSPENEINAMNTVRIKKEKCFGLDDVDEMNAKRMKVN